ncbi:DMT family transporter [Ihubacter massiliensis]|uniref:DMT family transporter n=1 Tax=Hominibacterium faecale TaxID=2839743 RepID=A0A9J6QQN5_9FIRM|nr:MULTISPECIES: DMT family transporter [Eubacteriales Family XIII. Incertae Sedis]MCO7121336.1 DMT family transporter [Ihubacter massiliensis]MCU7378322.1 DMT family transporter [Hominibacterium faecale]
MDKTNSVKGYGAAILFSILVGFSFLGVKTCVPLASSLQILVHRYNFAFLALVIILALRIGKINLRGKPKKNLILTAGFYVGFMVLQVVGLIFSTSIEGSIIFAIIPIIAKIIASLFLGEKSSVLQNIFVCLTVAALIVMIVMGSTTVSLNIGGAILLVLSSISMAISNVFMRYVRDQYKPIEISAAIIIGGCVIFNLAFLVQGLFSGTLHTYFEPFSHPEFIIATAYLGVGCILLSAQLMSYSLSKMEAVKATIFGNVSTAISIIAGVVVLGEPLLAYHIVCTVLIIVGVVGLSVSGKKKEADDEIQNSDGE